MYAYILKYKKKLTKLNYFIEQKESIGNEKPKINTPKVEKKVVNSNDNSVTYFQCFSEYLLNSKHERITSKRKKGMRLQLQKVVYNAFEVYLVIEIENKSGIDFELDYLNIYRTNGNNKRKASFQRLQQEVIYKYKIPINIKDKELKRFIYVLPKFVLGENEKLLIELQELKGGRNLILKTKL